MPRILVDLSHNERYKQIPKGIFDFEYNFEFLYPGMHFPVYDLLCNYDLIILGEIIPAQNVTDHLFLDSELGVLKQDVKDGGKLLITTSSGGDFDYEREDEDIEDYKSIRALSVVSGVKRYWWGELFHPIKKMHYKNPEDLLITHFPPHPIFSGITRIMLSDTTFLEPSTVYIPQTILTSEEGSMFRYFVDDSEELVDEVPLITYYELGRGGCMVIGSTLFMSKQVEFGCSIENNSKFFSNIIHWLLD